MTMLPAILRAFISLAAACTVKKVPALGQLHPDA